MISEKRFANGAFSPVFSLFICLIISEILLKWRFFSFSEKHQRRAQEIRTNAIWLTNALMISEKRCADGAVFFCFPCFLVKPKFVCKFNSAKICVFYTTSSLGFLRGIDLVMVLCHVKALVLSFELGGSDRLEFGFLSRYAICSFFSCGFLLQ